LHGWLWLHMFQIQFFWMDMYFCWFQSLPYHYINNFVVIFCHIIDIFNDHKNSSKSTLFSWNEVFLLVFLTYHLPLSMFIISNILKLQCLSVCPSRSWNPYLFVSGLKKWGVCLFRDMGQGQGRAGQLFSL
jgi:hypothetical protein